METLEHLQVRCPDASAAAQPTQPDSATVRRFRPHLRHEKFVWRRAGAGR